jgi:hypothetical protein
MFRILRVVLFGKAAALDELRGGCRILFLEWRAKTDRPMIANPLFRTTDVLAEERS